MIQEIIHQITRLLVWFVVVAPWEQALRIRFGHRVQLLGAGIYLVIPFVDRLYRQSVRRRLGVVAPQILTTKDGASVSIGSAIGYSIEDLKKLYETLHDADDTIDASVSALVAQFVSGHDKSECTPEAIEQFVSQELDLAQYGLGSQEFYVTNFSVAKTYRLVTGEIRGWMRGSGLNTQMFDGQKV
jgi:hypothetical protein